MNTRIIKIEDSPITHHPVDDIEPIPVDDSIERTLDAFRILMAWLLGGHGIRSHASRLLVLALHLDIQCCVTNYEQIAKLVGFTRSNVQLQGRHLEKTYNLRFNQSRTDTTRRANRRAAKS